MQLFACRTVFGVPHQHILDIPSVGGASLHAANAAQCSQQQASADDRSKINTFCKKCHNYGISQ